MRPYSGESADLRVEARRRRLLDAAYRRMTVEGGWRSTSIAQLCRDTGLNKRYFYESFADLDELAGAVVDDLAARLLAIGGEAAAAGIAVGLDTEPLARAVLRATVGWLVEDRGRATVLFAVASDHPRALARRRHAVDLLAGGLAAFSVDYHAAPETPPIVRVGSALLVGGSIEAVLAWLEDDGGTGLDELVEELAAFWVAVGDRAVELATRRGAPEGR